MLITELDKTPVVVAGDYLKKLVAHAQLVLERRFGDALRTMELQYILTVPAMWSDKGKYRTLQAAYQAGMPASRVTLLSEPEAAAVYAIQTIQSNTIAKRDCLIVCDAGGGTVDIITYRVMQTEPLKFEEATKGTGAVCGSVMLDERFDAVLKDLIEKQSHQPLPHGTAKAARQYWQDYIKPNYSGPLDEEGFCEAGYWVPVPGLSGIKYVELSDGHLYLDKDQVKDIFDPIILQIEKLVAEQIMSVKAAGLSTKAIILVGGLGASGYLFKSLQASSDGIRIMQPPNAWSAVARGAVIRGQEGNQVNSRIARCNYGTEFYTLHDVRKDEKHGNSEWCPYDEKWKLYGSMA